MKGALFHSPFPLLRMTCLSPNIKLPKPSLSPHGQFFSRINPAQTSPHGVFLHLYCSKHPQIPGRRRGLRAFACSLSCSSGSVEQRVCGVEYVHHWDGFTGTCLQTWVEMILYSWHPWISYICRFPARHDPSPFCSTMFIIQASNISFRRIGELFTVHISVHLGRPPTSTSCPGAKLDFPSTKMLKLSHSICERLVVFLLARQ
jgi:hypothetical protein